MSEVRPLPEFWYPVARILLVLKSLLATTAPSLPDARVRRRLARPFCLAEPPAPRRAPGKPPSPHVELALALHRTEILLAALRWPPLLRESAVRWHVLRALPPALDCLLTCLDCLARPDLWAGIDPDTC